MWLDEKQSLMCLNKWACLSSRKPEPHFLLLKKKSFLIHEADHSRDHYFHTGCPSVRPSVTKLQNTTKNHCWPVLWAGRVDHCWLLPFPHLILGQAGASMLHHLWTMHPWHNVSFLFWPPLESETYWLERNEPIDLEGCILPEKRNEKV